MIKNLKDLSAACLAQRQQKHPDVPYIPKRTYSDKKANDLTKALIRYFDLIGGHANRINVMGGRTRDVYDTDYAGRKVVSVRGSWRSSTTQRGTADIDAVYKGRAIKVEVKIGRDRMSEDQHKYAGGIERSGGVYIVARTFEGFVSEFENVSDQW